VQHNIFIVLRVRDCLQRNDILLLYLRSPRSAFLSVV